MDEGRLFEIWVDEQYNVHYPANLDELTLRGWMDKIVDGIKESMKLRAMIAAGGRKG